MNTHTKEIKRQLPCHFSPDQLRDKSEMLAQKLEEKGKIEDEKKQVMTGYKQRIELVDAEVAVLAHHIRQKFEFQEVNCVVMMDTPKFGRKTIQRMDTGEIVGEEFMTPEDRQIVMQFETDAAGAPINDPPDTDTPPGRRFQ